MFQLLPNILSLSRIPLALFFLSENVTIRITALIAAVISDLLDGYISRKYRLVSYSGKILDPLTDKFFVYFVLYTIHHKFSTMHICFLLCRDFAILIFLFILLIYNKFHRFTATTFYCGKVFTALQFLIVGCLVLNVSFHPLVYYLFLILGLSSFVELSYMYKVQNSNQSNRSTPIK